MQRSVELKWRLLALTHKNNETKYTGWFSEIGMDDEFNTVGTVDDLSRM
jgi:hypothetical protein